MARSFEIIRRKMLSVRSKRMKTSKKRKAAYLNKPDEMGPDIVKNEDDLTVKSWHDIWTSLKNLGPLFKGIKPPRHVGENDYDDLRNEAKRKRKAFNEAKAANFVGYTAIRKKQLEDEASLAEAKRTAYMFMRSNQVGVNELEIHLDGQDILTSMKIIEIFLWIGFNMKAIGTICFVTGNEISTASAAVNARASRVRYESLKKRVEYILEQEKLILSQLSRDGVLLIKTKLGKTFHILERKRR